MPVLDKVAMRQLLFEKHIKNVAAHGDADGIAAAVLAYLALKPEKITFEGNFHKVVMSDGTLAELVLDKVPPEDYPHFVIDHHPHPPKPAYKLFTNRKPTSLLVLDVFTDDIPTNQKWKAVVGAVGDLEPYKVPDYIWVENQFLLEERTVPFTRYGRVRMYPAPVFSKLSSPINICCRAGKSILAFNRLLKAKEPFDLFRDEEIRQIGRDVKKEIRRLEMTANIVDLKYLVFWEIETSMALAGIEASRIKSGAKKTTVVVNAANGKISIRGVLCNLIKNRLPDYGIGGHDMAMGGELPSDKTPDDMLRDLRNIFR